MMLRYVTDPFDVVMVLDMSLCFLITPISANCFLIYFKMLGFPPEVERGKGGIPPCLPPPLDEKLACPHPHVPHCFDPRMPILLFSCSFWSSRPYCPSSKSNPFGKPWDVQSDKGSLKIMSHSKGSRWLHFRTFHFSFPLLVCKCKWGRQEGGRNYNCL